MIIKICQSELSPNKFLVGLDNVEKNISKFLKKYSPIFALSLNCLGAILLIFCTGIYTGDGFIFQSSGANGKALEAIYLLHPTLFKLGLLLIIVGFCIQIINEFFRLKEKGG